MELSLSLGFLALSLCPDAAPVGALHQGQRDAGLTRCRCLENDFVIFMDEWMHRASRTNQKYLI